METIYLTIPVRRPQPAPIIDLNEYRQMLERRRAPEPAEEPAAPCRQASPAPEQQGLRALLRNCRRPESLGELLDIAASGAMVLTALAAAAVMVF